MAKHKSKEQKEKDKLTEEATQKINDYLNEQGKDGQCKFLYAEKLRKYFINNPDPTMDKLRMINAQVHELRHHKLQSAKAYQESQSDGVTTFRNQYGVLLDKKELYSLYISETQTCHITLSRIRSNLINLLPYVDGNIFTYEEFDSYVRTVEEKVTELGFNLFPERVEMVMPL